VKTQEAMEKQLEQEALSVKVEYGVDRLRLLGKLVRKQKGDPEFTSEQARAFLLLHRVELQERLDATVRQFLKEKL
jgi:hypothetical protein